MTDTVALAVIATIPPTAASLAAMVVALLNGRKSSLIQHQTEVNSIKQDLTQRQAELITTKTDNIAAKTEAIHEGVNSNYQALKAELMLAHAEIARLKTVLSLTAQKPEAAPKDGAP